MRTKWFKSTQRYGTDLFWFKEITSAQTSSKIMHVSTLKTKTTLMRHQGLKTRKWNKPPWEIQDQVKMLSSEISMKIKEEETLNNLQVSTSLKILMRISMKLTKDMKDSMNITNKENMDMMRDITKTTMMMMKTIIRIVGLEPVDYVEFFIYLCLWAKIGIFSIF